MKPIREGEWHPLENIYILEEIFQNCTVEELKVCRQVCRVWRMGAAKALRESSTVTIDCRENEDKLSRFLEFLEQENNRFLVMAPFNFSLYLNNSGINPRFWTLCGAHIRHLSLRKGDFRSAQDFREAIFERCPNLEFLFLKDFNVHLTTGEYIRIPREWQPPRYPQNFNMKVLQFSVYITRFGVSFFEIFNQFPGLETLDIQGIAYNSKEVFKALGTIRRQNQEICKLHTLKFSFKRIEEYNKNSNYLEKIVDVLVDGDLEFKEFKICDIDYVEEADSLWPILRGHSTSLKRLALSGNASHFASYNAKLPDLLPIPNDLVLENVTVFELTGSLFNSMEFIKLFPNLKTLMMKEFSIEVSVSNTSLRTINNVVLSSCTWLKIESLHRIPKPEDLERLGVWLPNLERIEFPLLNHPTFGTLCRTWPNLRSLKIVKSDLYDSGITGLDVDDVNKINRAGESDAEKPITMRSVNITSLQNLQRFSVHTKYPLKYCSFRYGIQGLPLLEQLQIKWFTREQLRLKNSSIIREAEKLWGPIVARYPWKLEDDE